MADKVLKDAKSDIRPISIDALYGNQGVLSQEESEDDQEDQIDESTSDEAEESDEDQEPDTDDSDDELEPDEDEDDDDTEELESEDDSEIETYKRHAADLTSRMDKLMHQNQLLMEQLSNNKQQEVVNTSEEDVFSGMDPDDYPTVNHIKALEKRFLKMIQVPPKNVGVNSGDSADFQREMEYVTSQPDFNDVDSFAVKNKGRLSMHPDVLAAGNSIHKRYLAVKSIMSDDKVRSMRKQEKQKKKFKEEKKRRGSVPDTGGNRKSTSKRTGKKHAMDKLFGQPWNKTTLID